VEPLSDEVHQHRILMVRVNVRKHGSISVEDDDAVAAVGNGTDRGVRGTPDRAMSTCLGRADPNPFGIRADEAVVPGVAFGGPGI
jgi:hypothetical protein